MTSSGLGLQKVINWFSNDKKVSNDEDIDLGDNDVYTLKFIDTKLKSLWKQRDEFVKKKNKVKIDNIDKEIKTWRLNKLIALNRDDKSIPYGLRSEKKCDTVASRKALLQEFTSKAYQVEVVYVDNEGKITEEEYTIKFQLSETQKDSEMIRVHGNALMQFGEDTPIKASWSGIYLAKKRGYKMKLVGDNIEKDFYLYCDGNETINFLIKKTDPKLGSGTRLGSGLMNAHPCSTCIDTVIAACRNIFDPATGWRGFQACMYDSKIDINSKCPTCRKYNYRN